MPGRCHTRTENPKRQGGWQCCPRSRRAQHRRHGIRRRRKGGGQESWRGFSMLTMSIGLFVTLFLELHSTDYTWRTGANGTVDHGKTASNPFFSLRPSKRDSSMSSIVDLVNRISPGTTQTLRCCGVTSKRTPTTPTQNPSCRICVQSTMLPDGKLTALVWKHAYRWANSPRLLPSPPTSGVKISTLGTRYVVAECR